VLAGHPVRSTMVVVYCRVGEANAALGQGRPSTNPRPRGHQRGFACCVAVLTLSRPSPSRDWWGAWGSLMSDKPRSGFKNKAPPDLRRRRGLPGVHLEPVHVRLLADRHYPADEVGSASGWAGSCSDLSTCSSEALADEARGFATVNINTPSPSSSFSSPSFARRTGGFVGDPGFIQ